MHQARNIILLSLAMALGGSSQGLVMFSAPLVGQSLIGDVSWATVPVTAMLIAQVLTATPASLIMRRRGRRFGFMLGALLGASGSALAGFGIALGSFFVFCAGLFVVGMYLAFVQQYRFAAIENATPDWQARAVSFVLLGGIFAGIAGPALAEFLKEGYDGAPYALSYFAVAGLGLISMLVLSYTRLKPLPTPELGGTPPRSALELLRAREIFVPVVTGAASFSLMTFIMVAAPLAMHGHDHSTATTSFAIQWHIVAMFAPSFITGFVIDRLGVKKVIGLGLLLLMASAGTNLLGTSAPHFVVGLVLLGVGWNFGFVGSTALLARGYKAYEASKTQGLNDVIVFGAMAFASIMSGLLLSLLGWAQINWLTILIALVALSILVVFGQRQPTTPLKEG